MRKKLLITLIALFTISLLPVFTSCGHVHAFEVIETVEATCETDGYVKKQCACGEVVLDDVVYAPGHNIVQYEAKKSTCVEQGYDAYEACTNCDYTTLKNLKPYANCKWVVVQAKEPSCTEKGYNKHSACSVCGSKSGYEEYDYVHSNLQTIEPLQSTCFSEGYYRYQKCLDCGAEINKQVMAKKEHALVPFGYVREATCLECGYDETVERCVNCGEMVGEGLKPALGHDIVTVKALKATCTEDGYYEYETCSRQDCNHTTYVTQKKTGHEYYTNDLGEYVCKICGENEKPLTIYANGVTEYGIFYNRNLYHPDTNLGNWRDNLNNELQRTVGWSFGTASLPTEFNEEDKIICLGHNSYSELAGLSYYNPDSETAFKIIVKGNSIFVLGQPRAIALATYELLNILIGYDKISIYANNLGEEIYFEVKDKIELTPSEIEREVVRDFEYLIAFSAGNMYTGTYGANVNWNASMGAMFAGERGGMIPGKTGGGNQYNDDGVSPDLYQNVAGGHNTLGYFPLARYNDPNKPETYHPEWFAKNEQGVTNKNPFQVCFNALWNSQEAIDIAFAVVKRHANWKNINISNMDGHGDCKCSECKNDLAYEYFMFLNKVAEKMANDPETAHMTLGGMLYKDNSTHPPLDENGKPRIVLRDNVRMMLAYDYADYFAGFSATDVAYLEKWHKVVPKMEFWTYSWKPSYGLFFFDDFTNKQKAMETMYKYGGYSLQDEGNKPSAQFSNFSALRIYLLKNLARDTGYNMTDDEASAYYERLTQDFFNEYFGPASYNMRLIFEKQKERARYMYNNWREGDMLFNKAYIDSGVGFAGQEAYIKDHNETGNNPIGTYSGWAYHRLAYFYDPITKKNVGNHGNRAAFGLTYNKNDFKSMLGWINEAKEIIKNNQTLTEEQKTTYVNRVELEEVAVLFQYLFIFDDRFAIGNTTYSSQLNKGDLAAIGVETIEEACQYYADLSRKYGIYSANYANVNTLIAAWNYKYEWNLK